MQVGPLFAVLAVLSFAAPIALAAQPRTTVSLSGQWEFLPGHGDQQIQEGGSYAWGSILVPALWGNAKNLGPEWVKDPAKPEANRKIHEESYCWYRKTFRVDAGLKGMGCLLRIVDVRWSAEVWLNGVRLGEHVGAYRPFEFDATKLMHPGEENVIVIKQGGGHTIPKYDDGVPKIPFGNKGWAQGASGIMGDIELRFFRDVTISGVKIDPNIHPPKAGAQATIRLTNHAKEPRKITLEIAAREKKSGKKASDTSEASVVVEPGETVTVSETITVRKPRLWSPNDPFLYSLSVEAKAGGKVCDSLYETFGMREFIVKNGDFYLNGKRIFLRGATDLAITGFPSWGTPAEILTDRKWIKKYLVDDARAMNANVFRTHMGPWYKPYYEIADEYGMLIVGEFPNWPPEGGPNYYERPGFAEKLYSEMELMAANLWNHPSIVIWAACNEPFIWNYDEHEDKVLVPFFKKLDPTRPVMRAGWVGEDIADQHNYEGFWTGTIGDHVSRVTYFRDNCPDKPWCDTEYLETAVRKFSDPDWSRAQKWMGYNVTLERAEKTHALFAMEQTEVKRRAQYDGLLPFWYGMFVSKGKVSGEEKWMTYYALKNAFAPIAVSVDLYDRHFLTGAELKLPVWAMNDTDQAAKGRISVYVVKGDPPYIYSKDPVEPLFEKALDVDIPPYSATPHDLTVSLPKQVGSYWIYATLKVEGRETVISKRPVHVLDRSASLEPAKSARIAVIENGTAVQDWAKSVGMEISPVEGFDYPALIIGKDALGSEAVSALMSKIEEWVNSGGRLIILDQSEWPEKRFGLNIAKDRDVSYLFKEKGQEDDPIWRGIADAYMENWNGSGAEGLTSFFDKNSVGKTLAIGSSGQEGLNARALLRLTMGKGEILACQIRVADRLTVGTPMFDPVAERLMVNLITATSLASR